MIELSDTEQEAAARHVIDVAVASLRQLGIAADEIPHALISSALLMLAETSCTPHLLEDLTFIRGWIDERIAETKAEMH